jgi:small subunit ribosomal protein S9
MSDDEREEGQEPMEGTPENEQPVDETPAGGSEETPTEETPTEETPTEETPAEEAPAEEPVAEEPPAEDAPAEQPAAEERPRRRDREQAKQPEEEVIPGAHLEPDIVFEEQPQRPSDDEYGDYSQYAEAEAEPEAEEAPVAEEPAPVALTPRDLAADARYIATGKRKRAVARVILKPGEGTYQVNGRHLDEYFPRVRLQRTARQPLEAAGYQARMDVVARIHGGGVSAQATALRHGIARALVEADPNLRGELKKRGYLTRDPRVKERKKAGLKKARKRPQFSKR